MSSRCGPRPVNEAAIATAGLSIDETELELVSLETDRLQQISDLLVQVQGEQVSIHEQLTASGGLMVYATGEVESGPLRLG